MALPHFYTICQVSKYSLISITAITSIVVPNTFFLSLALLLGSLFSIRPVTLKVQMMYRNVPLIASIVRILKLNNVGFGKKKYLHPFYLYLHACTFYLQGTRVVRCCVVMSED